MTVQNTDPKEMAREMRTFIKGAFIAGPTLGVLSAIGYYFVATSSHPWDASKDTFNAAILIYGLGFAFPILSISCRLMIRMFFQNCEQLGNFNYLIDSFRRAQDKAPELLENIQTVVDKAVPISNNIEEIVTRAKDMAGDVEAIAHKVRATMDGLNGALDVKALEGRFREVERHLGVIAGAFGGTSSSSSGEADLFQAGGGRKK